MEKKGRGGKTVTVVDGLPDNAAFLKELSQELKRLCGTGGAVADGAVELQGDLRDRVRGIPGEEFDIERLNTRSPVRIHQEIGDHVTGGHRDSGT